VTALSAAEAMGTFIKKLQFQQSLDVKLGAKLRTGIANPQASNSPKCASKNSNTERFIRQVGRNDEPWSAAPRSPTAATVQKKGADSAAPFNSLVRRS
jgi:hypothetical protein